MTTASDFWNVPNQLTLGRIAVVPVVMWMVSLEAPFWAWVTFAIWLAAVLTDIVDGYLARKWNLQSVMGALLDPLADKLIVTGVMIMLIPLGRLPALLVALMVLREVTITAVRSMAISEGLVLSASPLGKYKTAFQMTGLSFIIIRYDVDIPGPLPEVHCHSVGLVLMYMALFFALWSAADYLHSFIKQAMR